MKKEGIQPILMGVGIAVAVVALIVFLVAIMVILYLKRFMLACLIPHLIDM